MGYSVNDEPDYARTYDEDEIVEVRKGDLRAILDVATQSMDFGSGFLNNEEVEALRKGADILGIDKIIVTPSNFVCVYQGHNWVVEDDLTARYCAHCHQRQALRGQRPVISQGVSEFVDICPRQRVSLPDDGQRGTRPVVCPSCGMHLVGTIHDPGRYSGMVFSTSSDEDFRKPKIVIDLPLHVPPLEGPA